MGSPEDLPMNIREQKSQDQMHRYPLPPQQHHLHQQQQADASNKCLLTSAVQLIDGAPNNGAPLHLRSKWNRIRERLGRIQTAGAENKQRHSSSLQGTPSSVHSTRSKSATAPADSTTMSHGQLSMPLPAPCPSHSIPSASISCSGRLSQQPLDPIAACQASSRRRANLDTPPIFPPHSHSSSSHVNAAAPGGQVMEPEDWPGASRLPTSVYLDALGQGPQAGQETCGCKAGSFTPSPPLEAPSPLSATGGTQSQQQQACTLGLAPRNLAHQQQQQQQQQQPSVVLPEQAQASALCPSKPCPFLVSPRAARARSFPPLIAAAPAAATATPLAAVTVAAGSSGGEAATVAPPTALVPACTGELEGGEALLTQLLQAGVLFGGRCMPTKPHISPLARSHTFAGTLDREGVSGRCSGSGTKDEDKDYEGQTHSAPTFKATATTPAATPPPTLCALSKPEQMLPQQPKLQCTEQPLLPPQQQRQHTLLLFTEPQPPCSPPPQEDHPAHDVRHRSWSQLSLSSSMLQQHTAPTPAISAAAAPAAAAHPRTPEVALAPCVQPPPSKIASAPLSPTPRTRRHHSHTISVYGSAPKTTSSCAPMLSPAAAAHTPGAGGVGRASCDLIPPCPPLSPQSLLPRKRPSFERSTLTPRSPEAENTSISSTSNTRNTSYTSSSNSSSRGMAAVGGGRPHTAAMRFTSPFRCLDSTSPPQAPPQSATAGNVRILKTKLEGNGGRCHGARRCRSLNLLPPGSLSPEQEPLQGAETQKPSLWRRAGPPRSPAMHTSCPPDALPDADADAGASAPPSPSTKPTSMGAKKGKQQADGASTLAVRKVTSAQELSPVFATGAAPADLKGPGGNCSAAEHACAAQEGARPAAQEGTGSAVAQDGARANPASCSGSVSSSSSPFLLYSGRSGSGQAMALWDNVCELHRCYSSSSSSSSRSNSCSKSGADMSSAKARPPSSAIHGAPLLGCHSSSSTATTSSNITSGSSKELPAVAATAAAAAAAAAAARLEHSGPRHSSPPTDVPEGQSIAVIQPAYSGLASVPEAKLEEGVVAGSEGGAATAAAPAAAAAGPDRRLQPEQQQQQQQQQGKEGMAGGRFGAKLLASLKAVGSMARNAS